MKVTHTHHLIPKHAGGTDEDRNLVHGLSITRHAMFHFANWQLWGSKWDYIAWKTLTGQISNEEFSFEMKSAAGKKGSAVTNSRYREEKKVWSAKAGRNQPREVKIENGKKLTEWKETHPEQYALARGRAVRSTMKKTRLTNLQTGEVMEFESAKAAGEFIGVPSGGVSNVATGKRPHVKGWTAEYL
jgi:hypothetical protein